MNTATLFSTGKDDWETPTELFDSLHAWHDFTLDLAANATNTKLPRWLGPGSPIAEDALSYPLDPSERCWLNPPYSRGLQRKFVDLAVKHALQGGFTMALLPARTDTRLFHECICDVDGPHDWISSVQFLQGRVKFVGAAHGAPFPSMIVTFTATKWIQEKYAAA